MVTSTPLLTGHIVSRRDLIGAASVSPLALAVGALRVGAVTPMAARLFLTPAAVARAKALIASGQLATAWTNLRATADAALKAGTSAFKNTTDPVRAWQRHVGWSMANLAAAFVLGGNTAYRDLATELASMAASYPVWGLDSLDGGDLQAADLLFGIAMVVDWLGATMDPTTLGNLVAALRQRGARMAAYATGNGEPVAYWATWWLMNHLWDNMMGLFAAGLALQPYDPTSAAALLGVAEPRLNRAFAALPPDGGSQESPGYWEFTAESALKFHHLATELLGASLGGPWLSNAASYRDAMALPLGECAESLSLANQADGAFESWFGPEYQLRRLAALNRDGVAQALAADLEEAGLAFPAAPWLNFVWFDPTVPAATATPPLLQAFSDLGVVVSRSDRSGYESMLIMRAGAPCGHQAQMQRYPYNVGMSHVHQDVNHLTLFAAGQFLLVDDGYSSRKLTAQHNTLLVNGYGQNYEGASYTEAPQYPLPDAQPKLRIVQSGGAIDYWLGEGVAAYPAVAGLTRFDRHVVFIRPDIVVVIDDLSAAASATYTLLWHPGGAVAATADRLQFVTTCKATTLRTSFVLPDGGQAALGSRIFLLQSTQPTVPEIAVTITAASAQAGAVLAWGTHAAAGQVSLRRSGQTWIVQTPTVRARLVPIMRELLVG